MSEQQPQCPTSHEFDFVQFLSLANKCSEPLLRRKALLKRLGKPAETNDDGPAVLFQRHLLQPDVAKVGGGEAPCIP